MTLLTPIATTPMNADLPQITSNSSSQHHVRSNDSRNLSLSNKKGFDVN
jgi:hypothetical protein